MAAAHHQEHQQGLEGADPPPPIALRLHTPDDEFKAFQDRHYKPDKTGFPIPKNADKVEEYTWLFDKDKDSTGLVLGDLLKRAIFHQNNLIADKRREMLKVMTSSNKNRQYLLRLGSQHKGLVDRLENMLSKFHDVILNVVLEMPEHFRTLPKLEA